MVLLAAAQAAAAPLPRDTVIGTASPGSARISASATTSRYSIGDGSDTTVAIGITDACRESCNAADPQRIADFLGTLIHGFEMELLEVQLDTPSQLHFDCGYAAAACYYPAANRIVIGGDDAPAPDGASREFVLAHEYGHHVARHREGPPPFPAPIDWGTPHWASYEHVCRLRRARVLFPGSLGLHYYRDPGEAFAEVFARNRFPDSGVRWRWLRVLRPDEGALRALRRDTLRPWLGRTAFRLRGRVPPRRRGAVARAFGTPLDGAVSVRPAARRRLDLRLIGPAGRLLRSPRHSLGRRDRLRFTVCGQSRLRLAVQSPHRSGAPFELQIQRP